jgi:hypothetical protein
MMAGRKPTSSLTVFSNRSMRSLSSLLIGLDSIFTGRPKIQPTPSGDALSGSIAFLSKCSSRSHSLSR